MWPRRAFLVPSRLVAETYRFLVVAPIVTVPWTLLHVLRLSPAGASPFGCLLDQYCSYSTYDLVQVLMPGAVLVVVPAAVALAALIVWRRVPLLLGLALLLGIGRFLLPVAVWTAGSALEGRTPLRALHAYCLTQQFCQVRPVFPYHFTMPLTVLSVGTSLLLYATTATVWLHLRPTVSHLPDGGTPLGIQAGETLAGPAGE